jgi:integrase family protein with SAM-like domain
MSASLALMHSPDACPLDRSAAFHPLLEMALNSVISEHSKRNYAKALDEVFALCEERKQPLSRALLMGYRAAMLEKKLSPSTVNVGLSAVRKLIGEAQRNGILTEEEVSIDTLEQRIRSEAIEAKSQIEGWPQVCAWVRL